MTPRFGRVRLKGLGDLDNRAWRRMQAHFRDPDLAYLNGTPPNRMSLWRLKWLLRSEARLRDRETFGIFDEHDEYIGTIELYDIRYTTATLGIIIGERTHWNAGYGPEAIHALLGLAFRELGMECVRLNTFADNLRAQAAFKKVGFRETGRFGAAGGRTDVRMEIARAAWHDRMRELEAGEGRDVQGSDPVGSPTSGG